MRRTRRLAAALLITLVVGARASRADAATFLVNSTADTTDGSCSTDPAGCTLREAVEAVVATPGRDTIRFDASVFPKGQFLPAIVLTSALPVIADPAGAVVDGLGAGFFITGGNNNVPQGLVFASAPGVPLAKVTVANVIVAGFTGTAVHICGGEFPTCNDDVSGAVVHRVVTNAAFGGDGIRIEGRNVTKPRVIDSVGFHVGGAGIRLLAHGSLVGARIQGCTFRACDERGIHVSAVGDIVGGTILDTTVVENRSGIAVLSDGQVAKTKITNSVVVKNLGTGIFIRGTAGTTGIAITDTMSTANINGIAIESVMPGSAPTLANVIVDNNFASGAGIVGETSDAKIARTVALANGAAGLSLVENTLGASVSNVITAANASHGLTIRGNTSTLQKIRADGNGGNGIFLTALLNGLSGTSSGNTVQKSVTCANDGHGIFVSTATTDSRLQKNVALGNGDNDFRDSNPNCDANVWSGNTFRTSTDPCIQ